MAKGKGPQKKDTNEPIGSDVRDDYGLVEGTLEGPRDMCSMEEFEWP